MIPGNYTIYRAKCSNCNWQSQKLGNKAAIESQAAHHEIFHQKDGHVVEIDEYEVGDPKNFPEISKEAALLIFIRENAQEAYEKNEIKDATGGILKSIVEICTVSSMNKESIGDHLGNLERARAYLAAFTQGLSSGHAKAEEPRIKAKREKERIAKSLANSGGNKKVNELVAMAQKLSLESISAPKAEKPTPIVAKYTCEKCQKQTFSLKLHKC